MTLPPRGISPIKTQLPGSEGEQREALQFLSHAGQIYLFAAWGCVVACACYCRCAPEVATAVA